MIFLSSIDGDYLKETKSIGVSATPLELREIAKFLSAAADELEEMGDDFGHLHLMDEWPGWREGMPDLQVFNEGQ